MEDNSELQLAREYIYNTDRNIYLTGKAGTGKTTFLKEIVENSSKRKIVVAPTGVAAINAGGVTIHSFFQMPFGVYLPDFDKVEDKKSYEFRMRKNKVSIIRSLELLIIDEISMVRCDLLDEIDHILKKYRKNNLPFGGVQLLMIGDLQQLPPVVKDADWKLLKEYYKSQYFFDSKVLGSSDYISIELKKIYRQKDKIFINLLGKIRNNNIDDSVLNLLNSKYRPIFNPSSKEGYIILSTHNYRANKINEQKMSDLDSKSYTFNADVEGDFPESNYPQDEVLVLKKGAQVMFTKNDNSSEKEFVNGTLGIVTKITDKEIQVLPFESGSVTNTKNTKPIHVKKGEWENVSYDINKETKEIVTEIKGVFVQYPLKAAWAITIHKSQGLTFEKTIIDAGLSFTHGQVYVALSRCKSLEGLVLKSQIGVNSIMSDTTIKTFNNSLEKRIPDKNDLYNDEKEYFKKLLIELYDFSAIHRDLNYFLNFTNKYLYKLYPAKIKEFNDKSQLINKEIFDVANVFINTFNKLVNDDYAENKFLRERISKGADYFACKIETYVMPMLSSMFDLDIDNKTDKKFYKKNYENVFNGFYLKLNLYRYAQMDFNIKDYLKNKASIIVDLDDITLIKKYFKKEKLLSSENSFSIVKGNNSECNKSNNLTDADIQNEDLFLLLKKWRYERSSALNVPAYIIAHQKALIGLTNELPKTNKDLLVISGIGQKFVERYGEEVLSIIRPFADDKNSDNELKFE